MPHAHPFALVLAVLLATPAAIALAAPAAMADTHASVPAGGGLPALDVGVDLARGVVVAGGTEIPIAIDHAALPAEAAVTVEGVTLGEGKHVVHVRVPLKDSEGADGPAWEAILAGGQKAPIFAATTGPVAGDPGERTGKAVQVVVSGATSFVLVGDTREELRICGQAVTLLDPLALYPATLTLRPATVQRLGIEQRQAAVPLEATEKAGGADPPLARLLVSRGSSVPGSRGAELTDGDPQTVWRERRPGIGQGEFVVMAAPMGAPITRMAITVSPPRPPSSSSSSSSQAAPPPSPNAAGPRTLYLVTSKGAYAIALPADGALKPGATFEVVFPKPLESSCAALVLDAAYARGLAHPDVGVAELTAYSEFDAPGATLDDLARHLSSERGFAAAQVLERAGEGALAAVSAAYDGLDARGRALAIDVAASHESCEEAAPLLARGLCEPDGQAPRKAREKLERCKGAAPVLAQRLREDAATRACVAPVLASIAPDLALEPIADAMDATKEEEHATRTALRAAFARALSVNPPGHLAPLLADRRRSVESRLEILRAAEGHLSEAPAESDATVGELLTGTPSLRARYLSLGPLGELARGGDHAAVVRIADAVARDPDWPVRAAAASVAGGLPDAAAFLVVAARDPEPRVREAAFAALTGNPPTDEAVKAGVESLDREGWWFVKAQAVAMLLNAPASRAVDDALGGALHDPSVPVRGAAVVALAKRRAVPWRSTIRERLDDTGEDGEVRAASARALGVLCDTDSTDRLTELARAVASPVADEEAQQIGLAALAGLAALQPKDLRGRIGPLLDPGAPGYVKLAAAQALAARRMCR
ncbi:MAG TPA: HEAT repeat domain-containing protein [Polyangiaceae bacterium]|jgi:hypothetical protein|nr:HEAT repeat domain-containing protein [Polyangiaceae bacterium]